MPEIATVILYVRDPQTSIRFYSELLDRPPLESSAKFALLGMASGMTLGLWAISDVTPAVDAQPGASELVFIMPERAAVLAAVQVWRTRGMQVIQDPVDQEFGFTATGVDPDGHRLRLLLPAEMPGQDAT